MQVYHSTDTLPVFQRAVLTIGTFDGVHLGHRSIITQLVEQARAIGGKSVILSFHPHPRQIVSGGNKEVSLLNTLEEKTHLLAALGVDHLAVVPFTDQFALMSAEDYVADFLVRHFHPSIIIVGYDHRFGRGRKGDYQLLETLGDRYGYQVNEIPAHIQDSLAISSTRIRTLLREGQVAQANQLLGYAYRFSGEVVSGAQRGRTIGFPTANLRLTEKEKLIPADGVYAVCMTLPDGSRHSGMMNIGYRPTVSGVDRTIEVHLLDFSGDLYGKKVRVDCHYHLRGEQRFPSLDALKQQLEKDKADTRKALDAN
jgi:riboflavin kinase/FMN adenylyltransferase